MESSLQATSDAGWVLATEGYDPLREVFLESLGGCLRHSCPQRVHRSCDGCGPLSRSFLGFLMHIKAQRENTAHTCSV
jgi:hypothetical protein